MLLYGVNSFFPVEASAIFTSDPVKVNAYLVSPMQSRHGKYSPANHITAAAELLCHRGSCGLRLHPRQDPPLPHHALPLSPPHLGVLWASRLGDPVPNRHDACLHRLHWPGCWRHDRHPRRHLDILGAIIPNVSLVLSCPNRTTRGFSLICKQRHGRHDLGICQSPGWNDRDYNLLLHLRESNDK